MFSIDSIASRIPTVIKPKKKLTFKEKMMWTAVILVVYYILGTTTAFGVDTAKVAEFAFLEIVFGSKFGSLITLGIGPIVTASIILQLLVGSKILDWDTHTPEGKKKFNGTQRILAILFCLIEAVAYVSAGATPVATSFDAATGTLVGAGVAGAMPLASAVVLLLTITLILQLTVGGIIIIFMDEVCSKWGIGSGVSLFIAAGVARRMVVGVFSPPIEGVGSGILMNMVNLLGMGNPTQALLVLLPLIATFVVFVMVVYAQGTRIEIPMAFTLPFGKFAARRWPLKFIYTSNIPVILAAAVIANVKVFGKMLSQKGINWFGAYDAATGRATGGLAFYMTAPSNHGIMIISILAGLFALGFGLFASRTFKKHAMKFTFLGVLVGIVMGVLLTQALVSIPGLGIQPTVASDYLRAFTYLATIIIGSVIFSIFWVNTAGMDAKSVASQFESSMITIPGFRRDPRIIEHVLNKYIPPLTILGGAFVGMLAGFADLTNALGTGTGILLAVMIVYQFYEQITAQHFDELPAPVRKFMGGS